MDSRHRPALSLRAGSPLRDLLEALSACTPRPAAQLIGVEDQPVPSMVTLVCGAGVSMDAGLPSWGELLARMSADLTPGAAHLVDKHNVDLMRKAGIIINKLESGPVVRRKPEIIRDALYREAVDKEGRTADAIAGVAWALSDRSIVTRVLTTNFDDQIEIALRMRWNDEVVQSLGIKPEDDLRRWNDTDFYAENIAVLHAHGMITRDNRVIEPLVLTETDFQAEGAAVRAVVIDALQKGPTIFVGVSLTDPNLVGPLAELAERRRDGTLPNDKTPLAFVLAVPELVGDTQPIARRWHESQDYFDVVAEYYERTFNVRVIPLKSYSQIAQALNEVALATLDPRSYLAGDDGASMRYGHRLRTALAKVRKKIGIAESGGAPTGDRSWLFSCALENALNHELGPRARIHAALERTPDSWLLERGLTQARLEEERFALFLWLRPPTPESKPFKPASYSLGLVGTSAYAYREDATQLATYHVSITPMSGYPAADAVFTGKWSIRSLVDPSSPPTWRTMIASVVTATVTPEEVESTSARGLGERPVSGDVSHPDEEPLTIATDVIVGAVTLNSNRILVDLNRPDLDSHLQVLRAGGDEVSVFSILSPNERQSVVDAMLSAVSIALDECNRAGSEEPAT